MGRRAEPSHRNKKQVAKGREFAFKMYLASDLACPPPWPPSLKTDDFFFFFERETLKTRGRGFQGGWTWGACQYKHINNLTASSAFEGPGLTAAQWPRRCSPPRTRLASPV